MSVPANVRPTLSNPIVYDLPAEGYADTDALVIGVPNDRDYLIRSPRRKRYGHLSIRGGRNGMMIGGYLTIGKKRDGTYPMQGARTAGDFCLEVKSGAPGSVFHAEGILIDASGGGQSDGFFINAPNRIVQIHAVPELEGLLGSLTTGRHADAVQTPQGCKRLALDRSTFASHYNTLYLRRENSPLMPPVQELTIRYTNTFGYQENPAALSPKDPQQTLRGISLGTQPADNDGGPGNAASATNADLATRITFDRFNIDSESAGELPAMWVYPHAGRSMYEPARPVYDAATRTLTWPLSARQGKITGRVLCYPPTNGDRAKAAAVGLNYQGAVWAP